MGPGVALINVGATCAAAVAERLRAMDALNPGGAGESRFYVSDSVASFEENAKHFLKEGVDGKVLFASLDDTPS